MYRTTVGSFARRSRTTSGFATDPAKVPTTAVGGVTPMHGGWIYQVPTLSKPGDSDTWHPEIAARVWATSRVQVLSSPTALVTRGRGAGQRKYGALEVPPEQLIGIQGDALYTTQVLDWTLPVAVGGGDDGRSGRIRLQGLPAGAAAGPGGLGGPATPQPAGRAGRLDGRLMPRRPATPPGEVDARQLLQDLLAQGRTKTGIARELGRSRRLLDFVLAGQKPGANLRQGLYELAQTGQVRTPPARRLARTGTPARVRGRQGQPSVTPPVPVQPAAPPPAAPARRQPDGQSRSTDQPEFTQQPLTGPTPSTTNKPSSGRTGNGSSTASKYLAPTWRGTGNGAARSSPRSWTGPGSG